MNLANGITIARIMLIPVFVVLLFINVPYGEYMAAAVFALAAGTDKLDGYVARRRKTITSLGIFLDPLADKLLVAAALVALVSLEQLSAWVAMVIIGREFAVTGLRLYAITQGVNIPADKLGKAKTVSQIVAILFLMVPREAFAYDGLVEWLLIGIAVTLTLASGIEYFWNARDLLSGGRRDAGPRPEAAALDEAVARQNRDGAVGPGGPDEHPATGPGAPGDDVVKDSDERRVR